MCITHSVGMAGASPKVAQTRSIYSHALHSSLTVAILLSPSLYMYSPFTHILSHFHYQLLGVNIVPLVSLPVIMDLMVTYHS